MTYKPHIDGLRALAVILVVFYHAGFTSLSGGFIGVDVFFVISGYLITGLILAEAQADKFTLANFYMRRIRRIMPAITLVILVTIPAAYLILMPHQLTDFFKSIVSVQFYASNFYFWSVSGYFDLDSELKPFLHTWSLAVEEQFYILFPIALIVARKLLTPKMLVAAFAALIVMSLALAEYGVHRSPGATFYWLPTRAWELLTGSLCALIANMRAQQPQAPPADASQPQKSQALLREAGALVGLALIIGSGIFYSHDTVFPGLTALPPVIGSALIIMCGANTKLVGPALQSRPMIFFGLISYSLYLWHYVIFVLARHLLPDGVSVPLYWGLIIASVGASYLSWRFVETPFRNKTQMPNRRTLITVFTGMAIIIIIGAIGINNGGFRDRFTAEEQRIISQFDGPADYSVAHFNSRKGAAFDGADPRRKILVIGDSFAKDLSNMILESDLHQTVQLSTWQVTVSCANLHIDRDFRAFARPESRSHCPSGSLYRHPDLAALLKSADEIWVASAWTMWQAKELPLSLENLTRDFNKPVLIFGHKGFGPINLRAYLDKRRNGEQIIHAKRPDSVTDVNALMRKTIPAENFIDVMAMFCGDAPACPINDADGLLYSYDGGHLTKRGADHLGAALARHLAARN